MNKQKRDELRGIAEKAKPDYRGFEITPAIREWEDQVDPPTVLTLLDALDAADKKIEEQAGKLKVAEEALGEGAKLLSFAPGTGNNNRFVPESRAEKLQDVAMEIMQIQREALSALRDEDLEKIRGKG